MKKDFHKDFHKFYKAAKAITYVLVAIALYLLQTSVPILSIAGAKPLLLIPFIISLAMFESLTFTAVMSVFVGMLCDIVSAYTLGYYAMMLIIICAIINIITQAYATPSIFNSLIVTAATIFLLQSIAFFFMYTIHDIDRLAHIYLKQVLPMCIYTIITTIPIFYMTKKISNKFVVIENESEK